MSSETDMGSEKAPEEKKRRVVSIPFLIIVVIIGLVGYFRGEEIMTYTMYLQEQWKHNSRVAQDQRYDKLAGPPKEGEYDWVAPDAPEVNVGAPAATESPAEDGASQPSAATEAETVN
jgi:hypothetical protein